MKRSARCPHCKGEVTITFPIVEGFWARVDPDWALVMFVVALLPICAAVTALAAC